MSYVAAIPLFFFAFGAFAMPSDSLSDSEKTPNASIKSPLPEKQLLDRARAANGDLYSALKSFVCHEEIQRYKGDLKGSKTHFIDKVSTNLSFENGVERYADIQQNKNSRPTLSAIAGAWSEGEFGTLLQQTGKLLELQPVSFVAFEALAGIPTAIYRFEVSEKQSPWDLEVGSAHYQIPFTTDVWISVASGEILRIARRSLSIPAETRISEIAWDVSLSAVNLNGSTWLLPSAAAYAVSYEESKRREWNQMSFSNYHRYGAESSLVFEAVR
jgi:hypothetical protein